MADMDKFSSNNYNKNVKAGGYVNGIRRKDRSLDSMDSYEDKKKTEELFRQWKAGKLGPAPEATSKTNTKQIPKKKNKGKKK